MSDFPGPLGSIDRGRSFGRRSRHGTVLIVAMVVLGSALFIGGSLLSLLHAGSAVSAGSRDTADSRALARSALNALAAELDRQRRIILRGDGPVLESQYVLFEDGDRLGVVRLLPLGLEGEMLVAEAGKLDLNLIDDAATLVATGLALPTLAEAIVRHRTDVLRRPYQSEVELLEVEGMTPELLYGSLDRLIHDEDDEFAMSDTMFAGNPVGLADIVTVYAIEPALQENGKLRINLNIAWSDELRDRVADRFGDEIADGLKQIFYQGVKFDSEARMFALLRFFQVPPEEWHEATDSFTTEDSNYHRGRLDLNTAAYEALRGLPGIEFEQAAALAAAQDSLTSEERKGVAWPAMLDILKVEQMDALGGKITTRCWTWRIRFEAGMVSSDDIDGPLEHALVYEAVIDLASPQPRIAYLRDVTMLSDTVQIASTIDRAQPTEEEDELVDHDESDDDGTTDEDAAPDRDTDDDRGLDFGMDEDRDRSLDFGGDDRDTSRDHRNGDESEDDANGRDADGAAPPSSSPAKPPARIGRWASGK